MSISGDFHDGSSFKYRVTRYNSNLTVSIKEDDETCITIFLGWIKRNDTTSYGGLFNKIEALSLCCDTLKKLIHLMKNDYDKN
jgi:hypothetical protein